MIQYSIWYFVEEDFKIMELKNNGKVIGNLNISAKALETIIEKNISEIKGVKGLVNLPFNLKQYILKRNSVSKVHIEMNSGTVEINCAISIQLGYSVKKVCEEVQLQIKNVVQNMTSLVVSCVNIYAVGLCTD